MGYFLAAYAILWGVIFGYTIYLGRRQERIHREIENLRDLLEPGVAGPAAEPPPGT